MKKIIILLILLPVVLANGVGNQVKQESGNYYVEFGIDPKEPTTGEMAQMSFSVHYKNNTAIEIDKLFIRISKEDEILFSSNDFRITKEGPLYIAYSFPKKGSYEVDISAAINEEKIQASFPVKVKGINYIFIYQTLALLIGILIGFFIRKKR